MEILVLREKAEHDLKKRFDLKAFNEVVLEEGAVPLGELRIHVLKWIMSSKGFVKLPGTIRSRTANIKHKGVFGVSKRIGWLFLVLSFSFGAGAQGQPRPPATTGNQIIGSIGYPRVVRLAHQDSTETGEPANGWLVASAGPIFLSKDEGERWSRVGEVTLPNEVANLCCATLYEMPRTVGQLQEGTLLRAASYCVGPGAKNPCQRTGGVPAITIFTSRDQGRTWRYFSTPVRASANTAGGLWEPEFEIAQDQSLVMFWSDETHSCCHGQQLRQIRTTDGISWRDEKITVTGPNGARPGMAIVHQNPITHRFFMTYEYCGANRGCSAYYRWSDDGWNFGDSGNSGTLIRTARGDVFQHAPANVWSPARGSLVGEIIVVGQTVEGPDSQDLNGQVLFVNDRPDASGPWRTIPAPVHVPAANGNYPCVNYSSALLPLRNGESILELAGAFPQTGPCSIYSAEGPLEDGYAR